MLKIKSHEGYDLPPFAFACIGIGNTFFWPTRREFNRNVVLFTMVQILRMMIAVDIQTSSSKNGKTITFFPCNGQCYQHSSFHGLNRNLDPVNLQHEMLTLVSVKMKIGILRCAEIPPLRVNRRLSQTFGFCRPLLASYI